MEVISNLISSWSENNMYFAFCRNEKVDGRQEQHLHTTVNRSSIVRLK